MIEKIEAIEFNIWVGENYERDVRFKDRWFKIHAIFPKDFYSSDQLYKRFKEKENPKITNPKNKEQ